MIDWAAPVERLLLRNVRPMGGPAVDLLVDGGRIAEVGEGLRTPAGATVVDGGGQLALPGLVDAHAHLDKTLWGLPWRPHTAGDGVDVDVAADVGGAGGHVGAQEVGGALGHRHPRLGQLGPALVLVLDQGGQAVASGVRAPRQAPQGLVQVGVGVDQPGESQLAAAVDHGGARRRREPLPHLGDPPAVDQQVHTRAAHRPDVPQQQQQLIHLCSPVDHGEAVNSWSSRALGRRIAERWGTGLAHLQGSSDPAVGRRPYGGRMDASAVIVEAHAELERLFAAYEGADGGATGRSRIFEAIAGALRVHGTVEGDLLYPALQAQTCRYDGEIRRQLEQAHLLDLLAVELAAMVPADPRYDAKVQVLQQVFRLHVRDEEALILPEVRRRLSPPDREELGRSLLERTRELTSRPRHRR